MSVEIETVGENDIVPELFLTCYDTPPASISEARLRVMDEVQYVLKKKSPGLNYTFASEGELINALRPAMIRHGLEIRPVGYQLLDWHEVETKSGGRMRNVTVAADWSMSFMLKSGEVQEVRIGSLGEASDSGDKAIPKAMTCAFKYALRQAFMIETGDDPDKFVSQPFVTAEKQAEDAKRQFADKKEMEQSFNRCADAIRKVEDFARLEKFREVFEARPYSDDQKALLRELYGAAAIRCTSRTEAD